VLSCVELWHNSCARVTRTRKSVLCASETCLICACLCLKQPVCNSHSLADCLPQTLCRSQSPTSVFGRTWRACCTACLLLGLFFGLCFGPQRDTSAHQQQEASPPNCRFELAPVTSGSLRGEKRPKEEAEEETDCLRRHLLHAHPSKVVGVDAMQMSTPFPPSQLSELNSQL